MRTARVQAQNAPLGQATDQNLAAVNGHESTATTNGQDQAPKGKKVGKKEAEVTNLLDKLRSDKVEDRTWASVSLLRSLWQPERSRELTPSPLWVCFDSLLLPT